MKQYKSQEISMRIAAAALGTLMLYIGYMFLSPWIFVPYIPFFYILIIAVLGLAINIIEFKGLKDKLRSVCIIIVGIIISAGSALIFSQQFHLLKIGVMLVLFLLTFNRAVKYFYTDKEFLYSIGQFYVNTGIMLIINLFAAYSKQFVHLKSYIGRYTVMYIVVGVFLLIEIRNIKYLKAAQKKRTVFDMVFTAGMLILTFILASQKALDIAGITIKAIYNVVHPVIAAVITLISMPFIYIINAIISRLKPLAQKAFEALMGATQNLEKLAPEEYEEVVNGSSPVFDYVVKFISSVIIIVAILIIIYYIYFYIDKAVRKKTNSSFQEEREFVTAVRLRGLNKIVVKTTHKVSELYKKATFNMTANNKERLRNEYKIFLEKLYAKKLIQEENITAWDVYEALNANKRVYLKQLEYVTKTYEEVRYGVKQPKDEELKAFRISIKEILKVIG